MDTIDFNFPSGRKVGRVHKWIFNLFLISILYPQLSGTEIVYFPQFDNSGRSMTYSLFNSIIAVDTVSGFENDTVLVPVSMQLEAGVIINSIEMKVVSDWSMFSSLEIETDNGLMGSAGWMIASNLQDTILAFASAGAEEISEGGIIFWLKVQVPEDEVPFIPISILSAKLDEQDLGIDFLPGGVGITPRYGDVSLDGAVHAYDAALVLKYLVGSTVLIGRQIRNADVSQDGTISGGDAALILQYIVGIQDTLPAVVGESFISLGNVELPDMGVRLGVPFTLPVVLDSSANIFAFQLRIGYDPIAIRFNDVQWANPPDSSIIEIHEENGDLYIAGASTTVSNDGNWLSLLFTVESEFTGTQTDVTVKELRWNEGPIRVQVDTATLYVGLVAQEPNPSVFPREFVLMQNYPNPFNATTSITYYLPRASTVQLTIHDLSGRLRKSLLDEYQSPGYYDIIWDASGFGSGVYLYRIIAGDFTDVRKCVLLK